MTMLTNEEIIENIKEEENPYPPEHFQGEYYRGWHDAFEHWRKKLIELHGGAEE